MPLSKACRNTAMRATEDPVSRHSFRRAVFVLSVLVWVKTSKWYAVETVCFMNIVMYLVAETVLHTFCTCLFRVCCHMRCRGQGTGCKRRLTLAGFKLSDTFSCGYEKLSPRMSHAIGNRVHYWCCVRSDGRRGRLSSSPSWSLYIRSLLSIATRRV